MTDSPQVFGQAPQAPQAPVQIDWGQIQEGLDRGTSNWLLPSKNPQMRIRLLQAPGDALPWAEVEAVFEGRTRIKYLMYCTEAPNGPIRTVILTKTAFRAIVNLAANGWELFNPATGLPVIVSKFMTGGRTSYTVTPAGTTPMPISPDIVAELGTKSLVEEIGAYAEWQTFMSQRDGNHSGE